MLRTCLKIKIKIIARIGIVITMTFCLVGLTPGLGAKNLLLICCQRLGPLASVKTVFSSCPDGTVSFGGASGPYRFSGVEICGFGGSVTFGIGGTLAVRSGAGESGMLSA